jgi:hypothetical protein
VPKLPKTRREAKVLLVHIDTGAVLYPGSPLVLEYGDGTGTALTYKGVAAYPSGPSGLGGRIRVAPGCQHARNQHPVCCREFWQEIHPSHVGTRIDPQ